MISCLATPQDLSTSLESSSTTDNQPRHDVLHEISKPGSKNETTQPNLEEMSTKDDCTTVNIPLDCNIRDETKKTTGDEKLSHNDHQEDVSKVSCAGLETKSEGDSSSRKSDSSDSSSWIRVLNEDKEGILIFYNAKKAPLPLLPV